MKIKFAILTVLALAVTGCSLAPLSNLYTARSQGKGNGELGLGAVAAVGSGTSSSAVPVVKFDYGVSDNLDIGVKYETVDFGLNIKYAFVNNIEGLSFALAGSYGSTLGGSYWYVGPVLSVKTGVFEPYISARYNQVYWGQTTTTAGSVTVTSNSSNVSYMHYTAGFILWPFTPVGLDLEYNWLASTQNAVSFSSTGFAAAGIIIKFD